MKKIYEMIKKIRNKLKIQFDSCKLKNIFSYTYIWISILIVIITIPLVVDVHIGLQRNNIKDREDLLNDIAINTTNPEESENEENNDILVETPEFINTEGNMNEWVGNGKYEVMVDKIFEIDGTPFKPADGYTFVAIHFSIKNVSPNTIQVFENNINVIINEYAQEKQIVFNYKDISTRPVSPGMKIEGYKVFEIPKNPDVTIVIKYGDYITINCNPDTIEYLPITIE